MFAYNVVGDSLVKGWMYQLKDTVPGSFIFHSDAYKTALTDLRDIDPGAIFTDERHHWRKKMFQNRYDLFVKDLINSGYDDSQNVSSVKEQFLAHLYNAITEAQNFN